MNLEPLETNNSGELERLDKKIEEERQLLDNYDKLLEGNVQKRKKIQESRKEAEERLKGLTAQRIVVHEDNAVNVYLRKSFPNMKKGFDAAVIAAMESYFSRIKRKPALAVKSQSEDYSVVQNVNSPKTTDTPSKTASKTSKEKAVIKESHRADAVQGSDQFLSPRSPRVKGKKASSGKRETNDQERKRSASTLESPIAKKRKGEKPEKNKIDIQLTPSKRQGCNKSPAAKTSVNVYEDLTEEVVNLSGNEESHKANQDIVRNFEKLEDDDVQKDKDPKEQSSESECSDGETTTADKMPQLRGDESSSNSSPDEYDSE